MKVLIFCVIGLVLIIINYLGPCFYLYLKHRIIERFFQGRIVSIEDWEYKVENICRRWIKKTPVVRSNDDKLLSVLDIILHRGKKNTIQVWQQASLYLGLKESKKSVDLKETLDSFKAKFEIQKSLSTIEDADYGILAFAFIENGHELFAENVIKYVLTNMSEEEIVLYKAYAKETAFVDTLGFICPFLTKYGIVTDQIEYVDLAKKQILWYLEYGTEDKIFLPFHAVSISNHIKRGICDWGRGLAWLLIALMDSYKVLMEHDRDDETYLSIIKKYADLAIGLQSENGSFKWELLNGNCDSDSSTIAVIGWYLACCYNIFKEEVYLNHAIKCRTYLMSVTYSNGVIDYSQGDTLSIGIYSRMFTIMPFTQGFALRMQREIKNGEIYI